MGQNKWRYLHQKANNKLLVPKIRLNRVKVLLVERNLSSKDLAKHLNKTESTVSRWCRNEVQPSVETLYEISVWLKVDIRELLVSTAE
ncbi:helix-turn-helix domain-containing protein [Dyadobacter chenwenxiniae]|uniref:Helix-turn-helix domain-containing protein n=1 Tax=Dyadobacter chenwenxiniae TaxID=2906456 RepID=A0A9X1PRI6_9BACT|nr:helix-turn-helix transcriptional regulator [Dyadobacter chenwenxiniae]MCF0065134.1 helix-turn-helix domain-containing protein [Dyadobacter chenwenxiniae]UON84594.1 helix-turn-helix domain-containing protein [Dyadobacter chenwenxiniae]